MGVRDRAGREPAGRVTGGKWGGTGPRAGEVPAAAVLEDKDDVVFAPLDVVEPHHVGVPQLRGRAPDHLIW